MVSYRIMDIVPCVFKGTDRPDQAGVREKIQMLGDGGKADAWYSRNILAGGFLFLIDNSVNISKGLGFRLFRVQEIPSPFQWYNRFGSRSLQYLYFKR